MNRRKFFTIFLGIFGVGLLTRLGIAYFFYGSHEVTVWLNVVQSFLAGENIYLVRHFGLYPYSPLFIYCISFLIKFFTIFPNYFLVKIPMIVADVGIALVIFFLMKKLDYSPVKLLFLMGLFFLNPVSILTSSFNASFGNIAMLFFLISLFAMSFCRVRFQMLDTIFFYSISLAVKHFLSFMFPFYFFIMKRWEKIWLCTFPFIIINVSFFGFTDLQNIGAVYRTAFLYSGTTGLWGWTQLISNIQHRSFDLLPTSEILFSFGKYLLIISLVVGAFVLSRLYKKKTISLFEASFFLFLLFFILTPGFGSDFYVWIIPLSILVSPLFTLLYSGSVTAVIGFAIYGIYIQGGFSPLQSQIYGALNYIPYFICLYFFVHLLLLFSRRLRAPQYSTV